MWSKNSRYLQFFQKVFIYLSITFFPVLETLRFDFSPPLLNRSKTLPFHRYLQFWEEEKVSAVQVRWKRWLKQWLRFCHAQGSMCVSWNVIMVQNLWLLFHNSVRFWWIASRNRLITSRIHNVPCHCNWRKQWAKPSHLTELDVLFSVFVQWKRWFRHDYDFVFEQELTHNH